MARKKTNQQEKKVQVKKKVQKRKKNTRRHVKGEIISWEELENRTGLTGTSHCLFAQIRKRGSTRQML